MIEEKVKPKPCIPTIQLLVICTVNENREVKRSRNTVTFTQGKGEPWEIILVNYPCSHPPKIFATMMLLHVAVPTK